VVEHQTYGGQHYRFTLRMGAIAARGISCAAARRLIRRVDHTPALGFGVYRSVPPWLCRSNRPYTGPDRKLVADTDCKRSGGRWLRWAATELKYEQA
jgi:hypothetical protein